MPPLLWAVWLAVIWWIWVVWTPVWTQVLPCTMVCIANNHVPTACWCGHSSSYLSFLFPLTASCFILSRILQGRTEGIVWVWMRLSLFIVGVVVTPQVLLLLCPGLCVPYGGRKACLIQADSCFWMAKPHRPGLCDLHRSYLGQQISDLFHRSRLQRLEHQSHQLHYSVILSTVSICSVDRLTVLLHSLQLLDPVLPSWAIKMPCSLQRTKLGGLPGEIG